MLLGHPPVLLDIVEEHFDELDFLWEHREANVFTPDWRLRHLAEHEERAEAHLDGLRLAELHGVDIARARLEGSGTFGATAAALVLWESGDPELRQMLLSKFREGEAEVRNGIRIAFRHLPIAELRVPLLCAMSDAREVAAAAVDVLTFHRIAVPPFDHLLATDDVVVLKQSLDAAGRARRLHADDFAAAMERPESSVRAAALQAAARAGMPNLVKRCRAAATSGQDPAALSFLGTLGDPRDVVVLEAAVRRPELATTAVAALGAMGRVTAIPLLLELMADSTLGVVVTAAYKRITGAENVEGEKPFPPPPVAEGEDEEEALPPDPAKAKADWKRRESTMTSDVAWQSGIAVPDGALPPEFGDLPLESRRDLYLRLRANMGAAIPDLELEALAIRQRAA
ncbi:MAG: hypothetical protein Q8K82_21900 [Gemmatimonadaceae bacterium]|nr:hypothetical protein [Gemmatimonadaceae bacterium]